GDCAPPARTRAGSGGPRVAFEGRKRQRGASTRERHWGGKGRRTRAVKPCGAQHKPEQEHQTALRCPPRGRWSYTNGGPPEVTEDEGNLEEAALRSVSASCGVKPDGVIDVDDLCLDEVEKPLPRGRRVSYQHSIQVWLVVSGDVEVIGHEPPSIA